MVQYIVANVDEIPSGKRKILEIQGRSIGIFNINGEFFAIRNNCPHQGAPLCEGYVSGFFVAEEPGEYTLTRKGEIVRCPWHGWEFDIKTGQSYFDPSKTRVRSYEVKVEQGCSLSSANVTALEDKLEKESFVAETYPVSIDKQFLVIDI
jgi:3-phenylpropionate/trans-cinnamate dioxygenase ferredoxin subunit